MSSEKRIRLIREISEISDELASLTPLASQFVALVSKWNESGDLGGLSKDFSDKVVSSLTLLKQNEIVSVNFESGETQKHFEPIRSLKGGYDNSLGSLGVLLENGTFLAGGGSSDERKGRGNLRKFTNLSNVKIKKISAGRNHFLMLSENGRVFSMLAKGKYADNKGQLGTGDTQNHYEPVEIKGIPKIRKIRAGEYASSFVDDRRNLWVCGSGKGYFPFQRGYKKPTKIESNVRNVFSGFYSQTTFIQKANGQILAGGFNLYGQCGVGFTTSNHHPYNLAEWTEIKFEGENPLEQSELKKISCSYGASFLLLANGTIYSCGQKYENGFNEQKTKFTKLKTFENRGERVLDFACGYYISVFLTDSGRIYMAGKRYYGHICVTLELFGRRLGNSGEIFWEIAWKNKSDREKLEKKISEGRKFKVSIWQGDYEGNDSRIFITVRIPGFPHIFVTEKLTKEIVGKIVEKIVKTRKPLKEKLDEKMRELAANFTEKFERENKELNVTIQKR